MSNPKKIEELEEVIELQNNDLMFASVLNAGNTYDSKKVTLANIASYVKNGMEPGGGGFGGYEMIDASEAGNGIYDVNTIQSYVSDTSKNYLWRLKLGAQGVYDVDVPFVKTLGKDCAIWIDDFTTEGITQGETQVFLNGVRLHNIEYLRQSGMVQFYAKAGQTVKAVQSRGLSSHIYIIPLASGGKYFFDTSDGTKFKRGVLIGTGVTGTPNNWYMNDNDFIERADGSNHIKITAPYPMLFAGEFLLNHESMMSTINGKKILYVGDNGTSGNTSHYVCLRKDDIFETNITSNTTTHWLSYPLL